MSLGIKIRRTRASNPRDAGRARMERGLNHEVEAMRLTGAFSPGFVRDNEIAVMRMHLGDIASIIDETVADDNKAGLLLRTIGYALDGMFGLGHLSGGNEPGRRLWERDAARELGWRKGIKTNQEKAALWHAPVKDIWFEKRGRYPKKGRRRPGAMSQPRLAGWILDNHADIPNLPANEQSLIDAFQKWERELDATCMQHRLSTI
jgi:hypothetical protein